METITNEQKAKEIAKNNLEWYYKEGNSYNECYQSALQAMEWKEEQVVKEKQQWIEKACEWLRHNMIGWDLGKYPEYAPNFIDDLKKAMEI